MALEKKGDGKGLGPDDEKPIKTLSEDEIRLLKTVRDGRSKVLRCCQSTSTSPPAHVAAALPPLPGSLAARM